MSRPSPTYHPYDGYAAPTSSNNSSHNRTPSDQSFLPDRPAQSSNGRNYSSERGGKKRGGRRGRRGDSPPSRGGEGPGPSRSGGRGGHGRHDPYERSSGRGGSRGGRRRSWEDRQEPHPSSYPVAGPPLRVEPVVRATGANQQSQNPYPYSREQGPPAQPSYYGQPPQPQPPQPVVVGYGSSQGPPPSTYSQYSAPPPSSSDYSRYAPPPAQGYSPTISYAPPPPAPLPPPPPALPLSRPPPHFALRDFPCRAIRITSRGSAVDRLDLGTVFSITERDAGEIKKWWKETDRAGTILGISFWDTRTALKAREIFERWDTRAERLDVDFGMPIPERNLGRAGPEHDQGTLFCFAAGVSGMATNPDLTDNYFYSIFAPFGELREIRPFKSQTNARFIEFYDSRACYEAHDKMSGVSFGQPPARWDIKFAWDLVVSARDGIAAPTPLPGPPIHRGPPKTPSPDLYGGERRISHHPYPQHESHHHQQPPHLSQSYQHGPPTYQQPPPHRPSSPPPQPQYNSRPPQLPHQQPSPDSYHAASRTSGSEYSQWPGSPNARPSSNPYESRSPRQAQNGGYGSPPNNGQSSQRPPAVSAWEAKRNQDAEKERERLEQAQKVQQLLAALKKPNESGSPAAPQSAPPPPPAAPAAQGFQGILDFLAQQKQQG